MRVVITGALGHIGSRLIRDAAAVWPGAEIVMIDNLSTQRYASLYELPAGGRYEFVEADVLTADLAPLLAGADALIHLAAITYAPNGDYPAMERVNMAGTERVAAACLATGTALLFPSTTSVYGRSGTIAETSSESLAPQTVYAAFKLQSEDLLRSLVPLGLRFVIFRMGTIFGPSPGMRFHTAVNRFCWQAVAHQPIEVWRTAMAQSRPYLDLGDAVRAMLFAVEGRHFDRRVYNVVTVNATVRQVVDTLSHFVPDIEICHVDSPLMNRLSYSVDQSRFKELGFEFTGALADGIGDTVALLLGAQSRRVRIAGIPW